MRKNPLKPVFFVFFFLLFMEMFGIMARDMRIQVNVGVVIDNEFNNWIGKVWLSCINISLSDFYASRGHHYKTRLLLINARDSKEHVGGTAGAEAVPIYTDNEYGMGILPYLIDALQAIGIHIPYKSAISPWACDDEIMEELYKLKKMEARVFIVHMFPSLGARLFSKAKEVGMMTEGYVWIMSDGMTNSLSSLDPSIFYSVYGVVLGIKPYVSKTKEVEKFQDQWKRKFNLDYPDMIDVDLNIYGLWAYDAATALAMAIEKVFGNGNFCFQKKNISSNLTDLETLGVSENGPELAQALSNTSFKGLTGDFHFVNQQLQPSPFQIVNINGKPKGIELSIKEKRLVRKLQATTNPRENSPSLAPSAQPMDLTCVPMELEIQKKNWLRIGVPVKEGFLEFVKVRRNPITNKTTVSGYCIDVFDAAMKGLPNAPPYCYIPFAKPDGESAGSYDKLVYQVFIGVQTAPHLSLFN
ncbi:hypothetical protein GH714_017660 [Hevea brasiliensis]|uniref:Receptor ligand binding region domain-containing protein n=1 Tax=Hevea brasiliensis TaxID=3981 RepID=A0A6A6LH92_HEVBR|nr:hypothetical protein GH714_017660 [Hevea brasiliensis]